MSEQALSVRPLSRPAIGSRIDLLRHELADVGRSITAEAINSALISNAVISSHRKIPAFDGRPGLLLKVVIERAPLDPASADLASRGSGDE